MTCGLALCVRDVRFVSEEFVWLESYYKNIYFIFVDYIAFIGSGDT